MLQLLMSLCYISAASDEPIDDDALVKGVENTLGECSDIVEAVGDFLSIFETPDGRRRAEEEEDEDESLSVAVTEKLETCRAIIDAVTSFHQVQFHPTQSWGYITLQWEELHWLNKELSFSSISIDMTPLFVASEDGDAATAFHSACDGKGPTVVIVQSTNGNVFGGYSDLSWTSSSGAYASSSNTLLFRLRPNMQRYDVKKDSVAYAIYRRATNGPTFGRGADLKIASSALSNTDSYTNGGNTYVFKGTQDYELNGGTKNFQVKDYVVLQALHV